MPIEIVPAPISRDSDGLARSSRNRYFEPPARAVAPQIAKGLQRAADLFQGGDRSPVSLQQSVISSLQEQPEFEVEYVEVRRQEGLEPFAAEIDQPAVILVAARLAGVRLIDNWELG